MSVDMLNRMAPVDPDPPLTGQRELTTRMVIEDSWWRVVIALRECAEPVREFEAMTTGDRRERA
jgi:hypothetical protein